MSHPPLLLVYQRFLLALPLPPLPLLFPWAILFGILDSGTGLAPTPPSGLYQRDPIFLFKIKLPTLPISFLSALLVAMVYFNQLYSFALLGFQASIAQQVCGSSDARLLGLLPGASIPKSRPHVSPVALRALQTHS